MIRSKVISRSINSSSSVTNIVGAGWTHNTEILWIRNLVRILTGDPWDDETDHCIALQYDSGGTIDLFDYLSDVCLPYRDDFTFKVNGRPISGHMIPMSSYNTQDDLLPRVLHVSFSHNDSPELDRMWVVLFCSELADKFDAWTAAFSSTAWTSELPAVSGVYNTRLAPTNITHPCLYQGPNIDAYIFLRPTLPTGTHP